MRRKCSWNLIENEPFSLKQNLQFRLDPNVLKLYTHSRIIGYENW